MCRYLIVGTGPAAIAAAEAIQGQDAAGDLLLIGADAHGFYSRPGLAYYLTGEVSRRGLFPRQAAQFRRVSGKVVSLDLRAHRVTLESGKAYDYDRLLLATGASAINIDVPGVDLEGVVRLGSLDDAQRIIRTARRSNSGVVVGNGIKALELVEALASRRVETHFLMRSDRYWHKVLDEMESSMVEQRLANRGVRVHHRSRLIRVMGKRGKVVGIETEDGGQMKCQIVGVAIGVQPRLELARSAGLDTDQGIVTDDCLQTSAPDVYAAGDAAQVFDSRRDSAVLDMRWGSAVTQGRIAGGNMAGARARYRREVPFNVTRLTGLTTTVIGTTEGGLDENALVVFPGEGEERRRLPSAVGVRRDVEFNRTRILVDGDSIVGAVVMGDQILSRALRGLIAHQVDITPVRSRLLLADARPDSIILDFWLEWSRQHEALEQ